jgi:hypothetical protein
MLVGPGFGMSEKPTAFFSVTDRLSELEQLWQDGQVTHEEYGARRREILDDL